MSNAISNDYFNENIETTKASGKLLSIGVGYY